MRAYDAGVMASATKGRATKWLVRGVLARVAGALLLIGLAMGALAACAQGSATAEPPKIRYGQDVCTNCGMIISEPRFATAYAWEIEPGRYESLPFDDMGDMVADLKENQTRKLAGVWAHDYGSEEWIDAQEAYYVVSEGIRSPMGHGVAAFGAEEDARALATELGVKVLNWNYMRIEVLAHDH